MTDGVGRIHAVVDEIGELLDERTRSRPILGDHLDDDVMDEILQRLESVALEARRELIWHLILQGFDRRILRTAGRARAGSYREWTASYAPEVLRPEDDSIYKFVMDRDPPETIRRVMDDVDRIGACLQHRYRGLGREDPAKDGSRVEHIGGQDELIVTDDYGYAMMMDGRVWRIRWSDGSFEPICEPARMPAGAVLHDSEIYFCATRWSERVPPTARLGGIYAFDPKKVAPISPRPVALRVPWRESFEWGRNPRPSWKDDPTAIKVYDRAEIRARELSLEEAESLDVSRPICYPNDLAVDEEGRYLYFTESSPYTSMGPESRIEVVKLARNGRLWRVDLKEHRIGLVAEGVAFADGVVVLADGVLVTELSRCRLLKLDFDAGSSTEVLRDLPGMPDGATRYDGKIWQALLHERTLLITLLHRFTFVKRLYQLLPDSLKKAPRGCGILVLDEESLEPLYCTMHDGSRLHHLVTVSPSDRGIFLPSFHESNRGLHWIPDPEPGRR